MSVEKEKIYSFVVLGFGIVIGLKASFNTGIGHLYGPLFFIALLSLLPFGYYTK